MAFTKTQVSFHQPTDATDPGFQIRGAKLRWLSGYVQSRKPWRHWKTLKISDLPKSDEVDSWIKSHPHVVDGDSIRRGDQTLAWAPIDVVKAKRKENKEQQSTNEGVTRSKRKDRASGMEVSGEQD
jgi:hypothetical protein